MNSGGQRGTYIVELKLSKAMAGDGNAGCRTEQAGELPGLDGEFTSSRSITWWLILIIVAAIGLIIWGVVWGRRTRRARQNRRKR